MALMSFAMAPLRLVVDLTHLLPGGANGGIKPFIFELLGWLGWQTRAPLKFSFLTRSLTHAEVRDTLARVQDEVICVRDDGHDSLPREIGHLPRERVWLNPPADLVWKLRGDVLYCPFGSPDFFCPGIPTICVVVDVLHRDFPAGLRAVERQHREAYFERLVEISDAIQCNSLFVQERLRALYGVPAGRLFTVYNVIQARLPIGRDPLTPTPETRPYFFYPANAWSHKNHEVLLVAFRLYRSRVLAAGGRPWQLRLTGHHDSRWDELKAIATTLDLQNDVTFHGYVDAATMSTLWRQAGALVFPSLHEGFGIPLLEAMHHGCPIIASNATSLPEVGGEACLFVEARRPEDLAAAMSRLADDPALRNELSGRGRERISAFSWRRETTKLLDRILDLAHGVTWHPAVQGVRDDGWIGEMALIGLPRIDERCRLELVTQPVARPRLVTVSAGETPLGSFEPRRRQPEHVSLDIYPNGGPLRLAVHPPKGWFNLDHPHRGARLADARLTRPDGTSLDLLDRA
jgi:glycosyltransferase involved in cell wall biosynthesis